MEFVEFNGQAYKCDFSDVHPMGAHCIRVIDIRSITADGDHWNLSPNDPYNPTFRLNKFNRDKLVAKLTGAE